MQKVTGFGEHMIYDAYGCDFDSLNSKEICIGVLNELVLLSGMTKISEPSVIASNGNETLGGKDPGGYTGIVFIQESHISIHTFAKRGFLTLDLYSCKEFNTKGILEYLDTIFKPKDKDVIFFKRGIKYPIDNIYE
jgi:S-adenosylmethionine decarboxylase